MKRLAVASAIVCCGWAGSAGAQDLSYLQGLLASTPEGGWVQVNLNSWSSVWPTGTVGVPITGHGATQNVLHAWSSMAWDSTRGNLLLWGGGHSSYQGNEMYVFQGSTGTWTRGSLASNIASVPGSPDSRTRVVVDDLAPQSAHTYEGNLYLKVNDMFVTLGGPVYNDAGLFKVRDGQGNLVTAGPWMWDPRKADPDKVGGSTGSGYDPSTLGGNMWTNRGGGWASTVGLRHFVNNTTAYREENGRDVVYVTFSDGGWRSLYKYTVGDVRGGTTADQWVRVGVPGYQAAGLESSGTIDTAHNLYVATATHPSTVGSFDLNVWNLSTPSNSNTDRAVNLVFANGSPFQVNRGMAIEYDQANDAFILWDGANDGTVYRTKAAFNANGTVASQWIVETLASTTTSQPGGDFTYGVFGKFLYVDQLDAFIALDTFNGTTQDAGVWLYKPLSAAVPELPSQWLLLAGLALGWVGMSRGRRPAA